MEREKRMYDNGGVGGDFLRTSMVGSSSPSRSLPISSSPVVPGVNGGLNYIVHHVSKFDTLAGVAIKYGVEVADIKRLNGLVTDLQMFALKTLHIPLPGRHPPSPGLANSHDTPPWTSISDQTPSISPHTDILSSFQSLKLKSSSEQKATSAMTGLHDYYHLRSANKPITGEGLEMSVYQKGVAHYLEDVEFTNSNIPLSHHRKTKSVANGFVDEKGNPINQEAEYCIENLSRRRQKSEADFIHRTPEKLLKEESSIGSIISSITGKGLALRPKSTSRNGAGGIDCESGGYNADHIGSSDCLHMDNVYGVRKSSSTSSLQDSMASSIWTSLKPDFQVLTTSVITRPIFDGLPKPTVRRNKAALD